MGVFSRRAVDAAAAELAANLMSYALGASARNILDDKRGCPQTVYARQVAMYLCHTAFEFSLTRVSVAFGRDRSTVAHACRVIEDRRDEGQYDLWISSLEETLRAAPAPVLAPGANV